MNENTLLTKLQDYIELIEMTILNSSILKFDNKIEEFARDKASETMKFIVNDLKSIIKDSKHD